MKKITPFTNIMQSILSEEEVKSVVQAIGYHDKGKKFTVYTLLQFLTNAAAGEWESYRAGADKAVLCGLPSVNYSTFSKKAADVPYEVFKRLFEIVVAKCNRSTRRKLRIPSALLLVDSTTITVGKTRLPWAVFHGKRSGIKLHVAYDASANMPTKVIERVATKHDGPIGETLANADEFSVNNSAVITEINEELINRTELENHELMLEEITGMWGSTKAFIQNGFGFCAMINNQIVSWCTSEYNSHKYCGIGIETIEKFQGKGIATIETKLLINRCKEKMITPYWDCWKNNIPSSKVAERAGFNKVNDYKIIWLELII